jgi:hypothetical protein
MTGAGDVTNKNSSGIGSVVGLVQDDCFAYSESCGAVERELSGSLRVPGCPIMGVRAARLNRRATDI